jgi:hypothetical protein
MEKDLYLVYVFLQMLWRIHRISQSRRYRVASFLEIFHMKYTNSIIYSSDIQKKSDNDATATRKL